jgi:hypothetical protein
MAVALAPMPIARESSTTAVKPGALASWRKANLKSEIMASSFEAYKKNET